MSLSAGGGIRRVWDGERPGPKPRRHRILLVAEPVAARLFGAMLADADVELHQVESYGRHEALYVGLAHRAYDVVILTNTTLAWWHFFEVIPVIQERFPGVRILVASGWMEPSFVQMLARLGVRDVFRLIDCGERMKQRILDLARGEERLDDLAN